MEKPVAKYECLKCGYKDYRMSTRSVGARRENECPKCNGDMEIKSRDELPPELEEIVKTVNDNFYVWDFVIDPSQMDFLVESEERKESFARILERAEEMGYIARLKNGGGELELTIQEAPKTEESNILINIGLFLATIATTFGVAGYWFLYNGNVLKAALFSSSLLTILGAHELGHKIAAWKNGVDATWPYFLPIPHPYIGTLGAIIKNKSPIPSNQGLIELGASGPLLGTIFAVPITIAGLSFSHTVGGEIFQMIPTPLLFYLIGHATLGGFPATLAPHPLAWAGFIGLLVTWLNLLPTGQLDGGHVARSFLSQEKHFILTRAIGFSLLFLSFIWAGFLFLAILVIFIIGNPHPGALNDVSGPGRKQKILAVAALTVFILCVPIPI